LIEHNYFSNRRQYQRLKLPIYYKAARIPSTYKQVIDVSLGGIRIHAKQSLKLGDSVDVELLLPDKSHIFCSAKVMWLKQLPSWATYKYDVGLQFLKLVNNDLQHLATILQVSPTIMNLRKSKILENNLSNLV